MRSPLVAVFVALCASCVPDLDSRCGTSADCDEPLVCDDRYCVPPRQGQAGPVPDAAPGDDGRPVDFGHVDEGAPRDDGPMVDGSDTQPPDEGVVDGPSPDGPSPDGPSPDGPSAVCGDGVLEGDESCDHGDDPDCADCAVVTRPVEAGRHGGVIQVDSFDRWRFAVAEGPIVARVAALGEDGCTVSSRVALLREGDADPLAEGGPDCAPAEAVLSAGDYVVEVRQGADTPVMRYVLELWLGAVCGNGSVEVGEACDDLNDDRDDGCDRCLDSSVCAPWWLSAHDMCEPPPLPVDCPVGSVTLPAGCSPVFECPDGWARDGVGPFCRPPPLEACPDGAPFAARRCLPAWDCGDWQRVEPYGCSPPPLDCGDRQRAGVDRCAERLPPCAALLRDPAVTYVALDGVGDGTFDSPSPSLDRVLEQMNGGARVVGPIGLFPGRHAVPRATLPHGVTLFAGCAADTTIVGSLVVAADTEITLRALRLEGDRRTPLQVEPGGRAGLEAVEVTGEGALDVVGRIDAEQLVSSNDLVVDGVLDCRGCSLGGVDAAAGASVTLVDTTVEGASIVTHGAEVELTRVRIEGGGLAVRAGRTQLTDVAILGPPPDAPGIDVGTGATLSMSRVHVANVTAPALRVAGGVVDAVIRGDALTLAQVTDGVRIDGDAMVELARVSVVTAALNAVVVGAGAQGVTIDGLYLFDARGAESVLARGVRPLRFERVLITQRGGAAVRAGEGAAVTLEDVRVAGPGAGIVAAGATLDLTDVRLGGLTDTVLFAGRGGALRATGLIVESSDPGEGRATLEISGGLEEATVRESGFFANARRAVQVIGDTPDVGLSLERVWVDGGEAGDGLLVFVPDEPADGAATLRLDRVALRSLTGAGVRVSGEGASVEGAAVVVEGVVGGPGFGLELRDGGTVALSEVRITGADLGALLDGGALTLGQAVVGGQRTGVAARGRLALSDLLIEAHAVAGLYLAGGSAELRRVAFAGNDVGMVYDEAAVEFAGERVVHHRDQDTDEARCDVGGACPPLP